MFAEISHENVSNNWRYRIAEIVLIFVVFYIHGAWPVPDVNEANYLGKAIHFWNPDWIKNDIFFESKDAHWFFYATFGWLSLILSPNVLAWTGRFLAWGTLAWAWQRLSFTLVPLRFASVLTAAGFLYYLDVFQMSGEWVVGGIEGKGFAFPLVLLGIEAMIGGRWKSIWIYFGLASAFHVLVGGWSVLLAMFVWAAEFAYAFFRNNKDIIATKIEYPPFLPLIPFVIFGGILSLPGLIPAIMLDHGGDCTPQIANKAHLVYVFERLPHHLIPAGFPWTFRARFGVFVMLWIVVSLIELSRRKFWPDVFRDKKGEAILDAATGFRRLNCFVIGSLVLAATGFVIAFVFRNDQQSAANLLRLYWFRMSDFMVPLAFSLITVSLFAGVLLELKSRIIEKINGPNDALNFVRGFCTNCVTLFGIAFVIFLFLDWLIFGVFCFTWSPPPEPAIPWGITMLIAIATLMVSRLANRFRTCGWLLVLFSITIWGPAKYYIDLAETRTRFAFSRGDMVTARASYYWTDACDWIKNPKNGIPKSARFLAPKDMITFKWKTNRPEVANWKEIPQDAVGILKWYDTMNELYTYRPKDEPPRRDYQLQQLLIRYPPDRFEKLRQKYDFDYVLCGKYPALKYEIVYENQLYIIYDARKSKNESE